MSGSVAVKSTNAFPGLVQGPSRQRQTPRPAVTFRKVMQGSANLLLAGARVATNIVGGPMLSAALTPALSAAAATGGTSGGLADNITAGSAQGAADPLEALQKQRMSDEIKLLALQDQIQRENRRIAMTSNVMKARHDTAKAAIANIRS